ncbi:MAG: phage major capsid protein [Dechloromonas sp.]|nr:phage major capsid protein [Dechloromonas sp.]
MPPAIFRTHSPAASQVAHERAARATRAFSFSRMLSHMVAGSRIDGYEGEVIAEVARVSGYDGDLQRQALPLALIADPTMRPEHLTRDLAIGGGTGGYLVATARSDVLDILRPFSIAARCGITNLPAGERDGPITVPKVTAVTTTTWLATEASPITAGQPTLGQLTLGRKSASALIRFSRLLALQSDVADALIQKELLTTVGQMIDQAVVNGSGASGQPTGILNTAGLATQSGTSFGAAAALAMEQTAADANGDEASFGFVTTPAVRKLLRTREIATGSGALWTFDGNENHLAGRAANVCTLMPAATMLSGPWANALLATWGSPHVELNPYDPSGFKAGTVDARLIYDVDVAVQTPAAWTVSSSIT